MLSAFLYSCNCDDCNSTLPYVKFYMNAGDTVKYPIAENDSIRIYVYYKGTNWAKGDVIDSNQPIKLNWAQTNKTSLDSNYTHLEFVLDQLIGINDQIEDLENYDYWIKAIEGPLQVKMSGMQVSRTGKEGRCACEQARFNKCLRNDSISDYNLNLKLW